MDLRPYTCFFANCAFVDNPFSDRQLWVGHLEIEHGFGPTWESIQCPLCLDHTESGKGAVLTHFARHMEDIALAALPRGVDSDVESDSETSSRSDSVREPETTVDENIRGIGGWLKSSPAPDYASQLEVTSRKDEVMASIENGQQPQAGQRGPVLTQPQRLAAAQNLLRQNPGIIQTTDNKPFPPGVVNAQIRKRLPPDVKNWQQLKQWAQQNSNIFPSVDTTQIPLIQVMHFQDMIGHTGGMPGIHPQAQMTPNQGFVQTLQPPRGSMPNTNSIQVTPQEIQMFRQRLQDYQQVNVSDDQLRQHILAQKKAQQQQQQQQQDMMLGDPQHPNNRHSTDQSQAAQSTAQMNGSELISRQSIESTDVRSQRAVEPLGSPPTPHIRNDDRIEEFGQPTLPVRDVESSQTIPEDQILTTGELWPDREEQMYSQREIEYTTRPGVDPSGEEDGAIRRSLPSILECIKCRDDNQKVIESQVLPYRQLLIVIVPPIQSPVASQVRQV
jgi:hypothetical protein